LKKFTTFVSNTRRNWRKHKAGGWILCILG